MIVGGRAIVIIVTPFNKFCGRFKLKCIYLHVEEIVNGVIAC
jgi:hypothetical protein